MIDLPNAYRGIPGDRPIVLKVHGGVDRLGQGVWESYVVSEDDHIDYLAESSVAAVLPVVLGARLHRSHFLFLGYPLQRVGAAGVPAPGVRSRPARVPLLGGRRGPDEVDRELWMARGVHVIDSAPDEFAERWSTGSSVAAH